MKMWKSVLKEEAETRHFKLASNLTHLNLALICKNGQFRQFFSVCTQRIVANPLVRV